MQVKSVSSNSSAHSAQQAAQTQTRKLQETERREPKVETKTEVKQQEAPKPVKNTQGQTTGTRVNVTA